MNFELTGEATQALLAVLMPLLADPALPERNLCVEAFPPDHRVSVTARSPAIPAHTQPSLSVYLVSGNLTVTPSAPGAPPGSAAICLPGTVARATASAVQAHRAENYPGLDKYDVEINVGEAESEVVFVPRFAPGEQIRGGRTSLGPEVHYAVELASGRVLRTTFAR